MCVNKALVFVCAGGCSALKPTVQQSMPTFPATGKVSLDACRLLQQVNRKSYAADSSQSIRGAQCGSPCRVTPLSSNFEYFPALLLLALL